MKENSAPKPLRLSVFIIACLLAIGTAAALLGCSGSSGSSTSTSASSSSSEAASYKQNETLASSGSAKLTIVGNYETFKALESTIASFNEIYPNCSIEYEYLQDYTNNLPKRLESNDNVDLFLSSNIQADSSYYPYALELSSESDKLDLSSTYEGLIKNFTVTSNGGNELYAVPLGGEIRGLYVNKTLLDSLGLDVPTNYSEFMDCCKVLKDAGYTPIQANPGSFAQQLMYPYVCNLIANSDDYEATYAKLENHAAGVSQLFQEPMSRLYSMVQNGYYNYKYIETTYGKYTDLSDEITSTSFLNLVSDGNGGYKSGDDLAQVAFMPQAMSFKGVLDKTKNDYHSDVEYVFILAPMGDDGGFAYLSPASGIAINKNSANIDWSLEFMNYIFSSDVNKTFAAERGIIPNTTDAMDAINSTFDVDSSHVSQLGQVSFSYGFYEIMNKSLTSVSKANNPKYMQEDGTMYSLDYYMDALESALTATGTS